VKRRGFEPSVALANESLIRTGCKDGILPQGGNDGRVTSGRERSRAPPATARRAPGGGSSPVSAAISEDFPLSSPDSSPKARQVRGVEGGRITFEIAPDRALGIEIAGKMKAWGKGPDRTDEPAGKVSPSDEPTRFQNRVRTDRDLGQIDRLLDLCLRLQVPVDDRLNQAHSSRLGRSVMAHAMTTTVAR
jgi:hypothetical protein